MSSKAQRLSELLDGSSIRPLASVGADPAIRSVTLNSREAGEGDLFCAIRGLKLDGEAFVPEAIRRGARAVVAASPRPASLDSEVAWVQVPEPRTAVGLLSRECYGRPDEALALVGITGTNGKTTVTHLVESIGVAAGRRCGLIGTVGHTVAGDRRPATRTTPEAPDFYRLLAEMRDEAIELVAMEVSSHALALSRVEGARFAVAAFLNLSPDHLDFHGDEASYFEAKAGLFATLAPEAWAVLPADSPHGETLARRTHARTLTFGRSDGAAVRLCDERSTLKGSSAVLLTPRGSLPIRTHLPGRHNLDNVAAAAACALALDLPPESIPVGVLTLEGVPGRLQQVGPGQPFSVLVDYAHTSAALEGLLGWLRGVTAGRLIVVFGCGGERDRAKRPTMGRTAASIADRVFLTSDNPRSENPERILDQIAEGVAAVEGGPARCTRIEDRAEAIRTAIEEAQPKDVVIIAGKGHETVQVGPGGARPFDDREVATASLAALGHMGGRRAGA